MSRVKLRQKPMSGDRQSLYLDFYPPIPHPTTGKPTRREFLHLHIFDKPKQPLDKQHNKDTLALAENIKAQRQLEVQRGHYGFLAPKVSGDFIAYYKELAGKRTGTSKKGWESAGKPLEKYFKGPVLFSELNESLCNGYREHLLACGITKNSALTYFSKFVTALKQAFKDGHLDNDLNARIQTIAKVETQREYLTLKELQTLASTECPKPVLKAAALFSALTGLRYSDIHKLTWGEVQYSQEQGHHLRFRQKKTSGIELLPISEQARGLLGEPGAASAPVFAGLIYSDTMNKILENWVLRAGITKHITFHCFRHTYATLQLSLGTDIYTVSKMLGHRNLGTTQIYAKIMDSSKRAAADKIKLDF